MATVKELAHTVQEHIGSGKLLEAFDTYYAEGVKMQENANDPFQGKATNRKREEQFLASVKEWTSFEVKSIGVDADGHTGDSGVAIVETSFSFINQDGENVSRDQVSVQHWRDGQIEHERFYYDAS